MEIPRSPALSSNVTYRPRAKPSGASARNAAWRYNQIPPIRTQYSHCQASSSNGCRVVLSKCQASEVFAIWRCSTDTVVCMLCVAQKHVCHAGCRIGFAIESCHGIQFVLGINSVLDKRQLTTVCQTSHLASIWLHAPCGTRIRNPWRSWARISRINLQP